MPSSDTHTPSASHSKRDNFLARWIDVCGERGYDMKWIWREEQENEKLQSAEWAKLRNELKELRFEEPY